MTWGLALAAAACALAAAVGGGVISGLALGRKVLGGGLAAMMGAFFGPIGGFLGVLLALGVLAVLALVKG